ncbi:MAG: ClpXP protease specificity-enhancing factor [Burkholderiales bacterium]|uniref:ClpXP protease specificity-enhancing factor n=1 Tax=Comamonas granuli TaxID=290309 RepID=UPI0005AB2CBF|nr:ClpXP protease specificity-enhancing factor [Comamonas granuli]MCZ2405388.1 ClpXP protease specificity-enhancing factor [Burkholderiales bacterium]
MNDQETTSTRPYLIRALHEWCTDNGLTPYIAVRVDESVQVPREYVNGGEIVLNVGFDATGSLQLGNDYISFKARFGGVARDIVVPVDRVLAIYARENGQGMAFPPETSPQTAQPVAPEPASGDPARVVQLVSSEPAAAPGEEPPQDPPPSPPTQPTRPALKRVK